MSWQLSLINSGLRYLVKPQLKREHNPQRSRRLFEWFAGRFAKPPPYSVLSHSSSGSWVSCGRPTPRRVILYLHGGGYFAGSPRTHSAMVARLCKLTRTRAYLPTYRLAPENPLSAGLDDAKAAFARLQGLGYKAEDIILCGDSAGGGLALRLLAALSSQNITPAAVVLMSPWTDLTLSGATLAENAKSDVIFPPDRSEFLRDLVLGAGDATVPEVSPLFADFPNAPPVFLQWSSSEILSSDSQRMTARLHEFGVPVTEDIWPNMPHVWPLFDGYLPEARCALQRMADFINSVAPTKSDS
ncbi:alpha/beta hydrolase [Cochlodiniinecator piscidefendens]|uniref:alpha/beta hydrolase n=1 Tax=Cochlodiniinecator piscidefendens TaxID=2715756 RepID=UPI0014080A62|nr:alpha/beta hydrolase [Cochlodiniinecator piscidefendens]